MKLTKPAIQEHNQSLLAKHKRQFDFFAEAIPDIQQVIQKLMDFQVAIPSWALGSGGTRFGRFPGGGEPGNLEEKIALVGARVKPTEVRTSVNEINGRRLCYIRRRIDE